MNFKQSLLAGLLVLPLHSAELEKTVPNGPAVDRVGFPAGYAETFQILRIVNKEKESKVVTVYANDRAASVTNVAQLPYPYGSVLVMETAAVLKDGVDQPMRDDQGRLRKGTVLGLHVMRRQAGFGVAYGPSRSGEWEYVEYRPDRSYITPPPKSFTCAECHVKAGAERDFVYHGRFGDGK